MIETGDYIDIRYQGDTRYRKPIGIYWLQAAIVNLAGAAGFPEARTTIWLYRVPSLIGAIGAVLATYWCALAGVSRRAATLAALFMASSILLGVEAHLAKTDATLLFTIVVAMGALARIYLGPSEVQPARPRWKLLAIFWTMLAVGILIKGPIILMVVGLTIVTLAITDRSVAWLRALRPLAGAAWMFLLILPWFAAIYTRVGSEFFTTAINEDMMAKVVSAREFHGGPPGLYLLLFFLTFFPASALAFVAFPAVWATRREPVQRFLLAWLVPSWIVFELTITKLPHHVLPLYPAIAILIANALEMKVQSSRRWLARGVVWWFVLPTVISTAVIISVAVTDGRLALLVSPFLVASAVFGFLAWRFYISEGAERAFGYATASSLLVAFSVYTVITPSLVQLFPSVTLAAVLRQADCAHPAVASAGYEEPSLVFLAGTSTYLTDDAADAADFLQRGGCGFAFVEVDQEQAFAARAAAIGLHYDNRSSVQAVNISKGRWVTIAVFETKGGQ